MGHVIFQPYRLLDDDREKLRYGLNGVRLSINFDKVFELYDKTDLRKGAGNYSKVYKLGDSNTCVKILANDSNLAEGIIPLDRRTVKRVLLKIKNLDLKSFYKILDITFCHKYKLSKMQGYIMEYYESDYISILFRNCEWFKENYNNLYNDFTELGKNGIMVFDDHEKNYIVNDRIILIDCDSYQFTFRKKAVRVNQERVKQIIKMLIKWAIHTYNYEYEKEIDPTIIDELFENDDFFNKIKEYGTVANYLLVKHNINIELNNKSK